MKKTNSQSRRGTIALVILLPIVIAATWIGRGCYDRLFILEGQVVVVNATTEDHTIGLAFPSGEKIDIDLKAGASARSMIGKTGEGSLSLTIDGSRRSEEGYLTSMNGMTILTINDDRVIFSQVSL
jgi:hypothetical protein